MKSFLWQISMGGNLDEDTVSDSDVVIEVIITDDANEILWA